MNNLKKNHDFFSSSFKDIEHSIMVHALTQVFSGRTGEEDFNNIPLVPRLVFDDEAAFSSRYDSAGGSRNATTGNVGKKYKGVRQRKSGNWCAEIRDPTQGKNLWIGTFGTAVEAARAFDKKQIEFRKEKAKTNFPLSDYSDLLNSQTSQVQETMGVGSSNAQQDEPNSYSWMFEENDYDYQLPEWKVVDTPSNSNF